MSFEVVLLGFGFRHRNSLSKSNTNILRGNISLTPIVAKSQYIEELLLLNRSRQVQLCQPCTIIFSMKKSTCRVIHLTPPLPTLVVFFTLEILAIGFANIVQVPTHDNTIAIAIWSVTHHIGEDGRILSGED